MHGLLAKQEEDMLRMLQQLQSCCMRGCAYCMAYHMPNMWPTIWLTVWLTVWPTVCPPDAACRRVYNTRHDQIYLNALNQLQLNILSKAVPMHDCLILALAGDAPYRHTRQQRSKWQPDKHCTQICLTD